MEKQICKYCGIEKELEEFPRYFYKNKEYRRKKCNECMKKYNSDYYLKDDHKEKAKARYKKYYEDNKEKVVEYQKEYNKEYYLKNKEHLLKKHKENYRKHWEKYYELVKNATKN